MNKMYDTGEYSALTSYRNSQNFCANWISAGWHRTLVSRASFRRRKPVWASTVRFPAPVF